MRNDERELCGAKTTKGTPCQNYADTCPWDHGGENDTGRGFTITADDHDDILKAARLGASERGCARAVGSGWDQLNRYLEAHDDFRGSFTRARSAGERTLIRGGLTDPDVDSSFAKFMLASSFDYKKTERKEVEHGNEGWFDRMDEALSGETVDLAEHR